MWPIEPMPCEAKLRPWGFCLDSATSSSTEFAGESLGTTSNMGIDISGATIFRST